MQSETVGPNRVDERAGQVHPAARRLEHPLNQVADLTPLSIVVVSSAMPARATKTRVGSAIEVPRLPSPRGGPCTDGLRSFLGGRTHPLIKHERNVGAPHPSVDPVPILSLSSSLIRRRPAVFRDRHGARR